MVYIILGAGFEESEAIVPCDLLRRAGVETRLAGIGGLEITGGHGITVRADCTVEQTDLTEAEMLILPGGLGGVRSICDSEAVLSALKTVDARGGYAAAICAAPTVLAKLGLTDGKAATCYPGMENEMSDARMTGAPAVRDGRVITGKAAGTAFDFGLLLVETLCGAETAQKVKAAVVYR